MRIYYLKTMVCIFFVSTFFFVSSVNAQLNYLKSIKKIDIHTHISSDELALKEVLDALNVKMNTVCTGGRNLDRMNASRKTAKKITREHPRYYSWITTFDVSKRNEPGWADHVITQLKKDFENGAIGVKVWKEIGMSIKNGQGDYIQIDDPIFEPIFEFLSKENKPLLAHIGEPIQAWMPARPGTYWDRHPDFSFWDKPDRPSYNDIIAARDHVIAKYPKLRIVGAHLGSIEFDVEEMSKRLDSYPNFALEMGGRTRYFMWQARERVRRFFIKYQDRIMFGTDRGGGLLNWQGEPKTDTEREENIKGLLKRYDIFMRYYATDENIPWGDKISSDEPLGDAKYMVKGLALPKEVLKKVFYDNAVNWFPGVEESFKNE